MLTQAEFANWQNYHTSIFPKFGEWFLGMMGNDREEQAKSQMRGKVWFDSLNRFNVEDLMAASVKIATMPLADKPKWFDDHLSVLLEILNRPKSRPEQLRKQIACEVCQDTGIVNVTAVPGTALFSAGGLPMPHGVWCAVGCTCAAAAYPRDESQGPRLARFDRNRMQMRPPVDFDKSWEILRDLRERGEHGKADLWERFLRGGRIPRLAIAEIGE